MSEKQNIHAAFLAGFAAGFANSAEGFNGECPYQHLMPVDEYEVDLGALPELCARAIAAADEYVRKLAAESRS